MLKACMLRSWIDNIGTPQLFDAAEPIKSWVAHDVEHQSTWHADEAENRVIDDFCGNQLKV